MYYPYFYNYFLIINFVIFTFSCTFIFYNCNSVLSYSVVLYLFKFVLINHKEFKWTPDPLLEGQTTSSAIFEADNRMFRLSLTKNILTHLSIEYIGTSYADIITKITLQINQTAKTITYTFSRYDTVFTFPIQHNQQNIIHHKIQNNIKNNNLQNNDTHNNDTQNNNLHNNDTQNNSTQNNDTQYSTAPLCTGLPYTILASFKIYAIPYQSRLETGFAGLRNLGATCYMNAWMQCLFHIGLFRAELYKQVPRRKTFQLQKLFYKLENDGDVDTRSFMYNCRWVDNVFTQQDIHEFAISVFHFLEDENKEYKNINKLNTNEKNNKNVNENDNKVENEDRNNLNESEKINVENNANEDVNIYADNDDNNKEARIDESFFVDRLFKGLINNYIHGDCGCVSTTKSTFYDLSFEIRDWCNNQVARNINESLAQLKSEETLEGDNQYHCEKHGKVNAKKGVEIAKLPPILLVLLKRFSMDYDTFESRKVNDYYEFYNEIEIDLSKKNKCENENICENKNEHKSENECKNGFTNDCKSECKNNNNINNNNCKNDVDEDLELLTPLSDQGMHPSVTLLDNKSKYKLFGVIVHAGGTTDGHYYCYINLDGWYKFNDTVVTRVCEEEALFDNYGGVNVYRCSIKSHNAYMLIYVDSNKWTETIETKAEILQSLIDKIKESESGRSMSLRAVHRKDVLGYIGVGLFSGEDDVSLCGRVQEVKVRSDDTLYVFEKSAVKKYVNIYDALSFEKLSVDDSVDEQRVYFICETSYKVKNNNCLVFVKKYVRTEECIGSGTIDIELKACIYVDKNVKGVEEVLLAMNIEDGYTVYVEEKLNENIHANRDDEKKNKDVDNNRINDDEKSKNKSIDENIDNDVESEIASVKKNVNDKEGIEECEDESINAKKKERKTLKKEIDQYIEKKEEPVKRRNLEKSKTAMYSIKKYDTSKTYKDNNIKDGAIFICVKTRDEENFVQSYNNIRNRTLVNFKVDNISTEKYVNKDLNYPGLLRFVQSYFMSETLKIPKFKGTVGTNKIEEVKVKHDSKHSVVRICNGIGISDLNKVTHFHELCVDTRIVRALFRKLSVLHCFSKCVGIDSDKEEFYNKADVKEEIRADVKINKKVYDVLKEKFRIIEVYENSSTMYEYDSVDEFKGDGLLVVKERARNELRMVMSDGANFIGYPIFLPLKEIKTVKELRMQYGILSRLTRYSSVEEVLLEDVDRVDNFDSLEIVVNYET